MFGQCVTKGLSQTNSNLTRRFQPAHRVTINKDRTIAPLSTASCGGTRSGEFHLTHQGNKLHPSSSAGTALHSKVGRQSPYAQHVRIADTLLRQFRSRPRNGDASRWAINTVRRSAYANLGMTLARDYRSLFSDQLAGSLDRYHRHSNIAMDP
jgi:hypothetical protein